MEEKKLTCHTNGRFLMFSSEKSSSTRRSKPMRVVGFNERAKDSRCTIICLANSAVAALMAVRPPMVAARWMDDITFFFFGFRRMFNRIAERTGYTLNICMIFFLSFGGNGSKGEN